MIAGCYIITHKPTGGFYIGSAASLSRRLLQHKRRIYHGSHENRNVRALGTNCDDFTFRVLLVCAPEQRAMYEDRLLAALRLKPGFLNRRYTGSMQTPETRAKISATTTGRKRPPRSAEWQAKITAATKGKPLSPEHRARIAKAATGRVLAPDIRAAVGAKIAASNRRRAKSHCGRGHELTPENTHISASKTRAIVRNCRACWRIRRRAYIARKAELT